VVEQQGHDRGIGVADDSKAFFEEPRTEIIAIPLKSCNSKPSIRSNMKGNESSYLFAPSLVPSFPVIIFK